MSMLARSALTLSQRATCSHVTKTAIRSRMFTTGAIRRTDKGPQSDPKPGEKSPSMIAFDEVKTMDDLLPPGAEPGTMPTDLEQATGLERLEILGKMQGVDVFDMRPLDGSRLGTLDDPIFVRSAADEQFAGCTGFPVDSHETLWLGLSRARPLNRCIECGSVYMMEYVGPDHRHGEEPGDGRGEGSGHAHAHHEDPMTAKWEPIDNFSEHVRPEYKGVYKGFKNAHLI